MKNFSYYNPSRIIFNDQLSDALKEAVGVLNARKAVIMTDPGLAKCSNFKALLRALDGMHFPYEVFDQVRPVNVTSDSVQKAADFLASKEDADVVIGFGGGSSLDTAKVSAMLKTNGGKMSDYYGMQLVRERPVNVITIPTTAGSGAEITQVMSIVDAEMKTKAQIGSYLCIPPVTVLCPEVLAGSPEEVTRTAGFDALTHCIEGYTNAKASPVTEALSIYAFGLLYPVFKEFVHNPGNRELASRMLVGSNIAAMTISNIGTGTCHNIGRAVGGHFFIPHGVCLSILLPHVMDFNLDRCEKKYAELAYRAQIADSSMTNPEAAKALILSVQKTRAELGMPDNFKELGMTLDEEGMNSIITNALKSNTSTVSEGAAPKVATADDIRRITEAAYEGRHIKYQ